MRVEGDRCGRRLGAEPARADGGCTCSGSPETSVRLRRTTYESLATSCPIPTPDDRNHPPERHLDVDISQVVVPGSADVDARWQRPGTEALLRAIGVPPSLLFVVTLHSPPV